MLILAAMTFFSRPVFADDAATSCRIWGKFSGSFAWGETGATAVTAESLDACVTSAQEQIGAQLWFGNRRVRVYAGRFEFRDGARVVSGQVGLPGDERRGH